MADEHAPVAVMTTPTRRASRISKTLKGGAFDKAYIDREVSYHQQVIDALDNTPVPWCQERGIEGVARQSAAAFVAHLEHANQLQSWLNK